MPLAPPTLPRRSTPEPAPEIEPAPAPAAPRLFGLSGPQVAGSALASATSAFAASSLGVAGTVFGALIGSLVLTMASAIYSHSLRRVGRQIRVTGSAARTAATAPLPRTSHNSDRVERNPALDDRDRARSAVKRPRLPWGRIMVGVAVGAVLALTGITALEKVMGHPVSGSGTSGTSIGQVVKGNLATPATDKPGQDAPENKNPDPKAPAPSLDIPGGPADQQPTTGPAPQDGPQPPADQQPTTGPAPQDGPQPPANQQPTTGPAPQDGPQPAPSTPVQPPAGAQGATPNQP